MLLRGCNNVYSPLPKPIMPSIIATRPDGSDGLAVEAWGQGLMVGSLIVMMAATVANMKRGVLLHKLIAAEVR